MIDMKKRNFINLGLTLLLLTFCGNAKAQKGDDKERARVFVQKFYDWYAIIDADDDFTKTHNASPFAYTWAHRGRYFDVPLRNAITDYFNNRTNYDELGLDFDPISAAQDTRSGFQTGNVKQVGNKFLVDVHDIESGSLKKEVLASPIAVIVEMDKVGAGWKIANFIYPADGTQKQSDLLHVLSFLRKDNDKIQHN